MKVTRILLEEAEALIASAGLNRRTKIDDAMLAVLEWWKEMMLKQERQSRELTKINKD